MKPVVAMQDGFEDHRKGHVRKKKKKNSGAP